MLIVQVPEKHCENRPVMLPRVNCEEVVVSTYIMLMIVVVILTTVVAMMMLLVEMMIEMVRVMRLVVVLLHILEV